jgi:hypothetical protein
MLWVITNDTDVEVGSGYVFFYWKIDPCHVFEWHKLSLSIGGTCIWMNYGELQIILAVDVTERCIIYLIVCDTDDCVL